MSDNHTGKQIEFAARALKMPAIRRCWAELAERARTDNWTHEEYLAAILDRQVSEREANGTVLRISGARFPAVKTLEDFNFDRLPGLRRDVIAHLATSTWIAKSDNVILLGPPGVGKTHLAIALGIKAAHNAYPVLFATTTGWVTRLEVPPEP
jgi:DNA replication protein DnaC